ncbi:SRPBCC family protein [Paenibacillus urinalis]|uniref:SRPBCC family protein n=1 Tax=Paenibacillus urinalis TaxID=521520 RepID=UPI001960E26F
MIAQIQRNESGYIAQFKRELNHPAYKVWAMLTDNKRLKEWFPELEVKELGTGGMILFDMQDGTYEEMPILDYVEGKVLEYVWGEDKVRFEIHADDMGETSTLLLSEKITLLTDHTPKDLAGWHVCLDAIETLLNGRALTESKEEWDLWYPQYVEALKPFQ